MQQVQMEYAASADGILRNRYLESFNFLNEEVE